MIHMTTTYKTSIKHQYNLAQQTAKRQPIQEEISKYARTYQLTADFEEDVESKSLLKDVPNAIAFRCILKKDGKVVGIGRGTSFLSKNNRYLDRTVSFTAHASLIDATVRAAKAIEALDAGVADLASGSIQDSQPKSYGYEPITEKQRSYLEVLIGNVSDEDEREEWVDRLSTMTRDQASAAIATLKEF